MANFSLSFIFHSVSSCSVIITWGLPYTCEIIHWGSNSLVWHHWSPRLELALAQCQATSSASICHTALESGSLYPMLISVLFQTSWQRAGWTQPVALQWSTMTTAGPGYKMPAQGVHFCHGSMEACVALADQQSVSFVLHKPLFTSVQNEVLYCYT